MSEDLSSLNSQQLDQHISALENKLESVGINPNPDKPTPAEKPTLFRHASDSKLTDELGKIYDKSEAREERRPEMPTRENERLGDRVERAYEWSQTSKAEQKNQSAVADEVEHLKKVATDHGLTLDQAQLIVQNEQTRTASEHAPLVESMRAIFPETKPEESARWFGQVASNFRLDPIGTLSWLGAQAGMSPAQLAQEIYQRGHAQPQQQPSQAQALAAVEADIVEAAQHLPNFDKYQDGIEEVLRQPDFKRSGNYRQDLVNAYKAAVRADAKLTDDDRMAKEMSRIYDRKAGSK